MIPIRRFPVPKSWEGERRQVGPLVGEWKRPLFGLGEYGIKGSSSSGLVHLL